MEQILQLLAAGGGVGVSATWAYWLWKLEPRFKALEEAIYMQAKVDLLRLAASATTHPELKAVANDMLATIEEKMAKKK